MASLLPAETNERQLPGQRVPQPSRDQHHEGAPGGQDRLSVLPGGAGGTVRFHRLLVVQVCHPGTGRSFADGGKRCIRFYVCASRPSKCFPLVCSFFTRVVILNYRFVDLTLVENWFDELCVGKVSIFHCVKDYSYDRSKTVGRFLLASFNTQSTASLVTASLVLLGEYAEG